MAGGEARRRWVWLGALAAAVAVAAAAAAVAMSTVEGGADPGRPPYPPDPAPAPATPEPAPAATPDLSVAPDGDDTGFCAVGDPCRTLARAAEIALPGDLVEIAGGAYPPQRVPEGTGGTPEAPVVYAAAPGAAVTVADLEIAGRAIEVRDLTATVSWYVRPGAEDVVMRNVNTARMLVSSARRVAVLGGRVGPSHNEASAIKVYDEGFPRPSDITLDGVLFQDYTRDPGEHTECLQAWSVDRLIIRNSRFRTCAVFAISIDRLHDPDGARDVLIENNWLDCAARVGDCRYNVAWGYVSGLVLRNNSFRGHGFSPLDPEGTTIDRVEIVANVGPDPGINCDVPGQSFRHNVWNGRACDPTDTSAPEGYVNGEAFDLRLADGAAAIGHADPDAVPATDIDGVSRPQGDGADAGASERP